MFLVYICKKRTEVHADVCVCEEGGGGGGVERQLHHQRKIRRMQILHYEVKL